MCWRRCHIFQAFINVFYSLLNYYNHFNKNNSFNIHLDVITIPYVVYYFCREHNTYRKRLFCISKQLSKGTLLTTKFQYLGDTLQRQRDVKRKERHNQNVFDLKFNSLFLILSFLSFSQT